MNRAIIYKEIDDLLHNYCEGCFLHSYIKKEYSKSSAHRFCIQECTVGQSLKDIGSKLLAQK